LNKKNNNIWVIIPAYNESNKIHEVIKKVLKYVKNVVIVDDGSKDNTYKEAKKEKVYVLRHIVNMGKGVALKTGCDYVIKKGAKILIAIDADGQHNPDEIPIFLEEIKDCDIVFGYRRYSKRMPLILRYGNFFISKSTKLLFGVKIRDTQCGYRAFTKETYKKIRWKSSDYSVESEIIANVGKNHLRYKEIPVQTIYSDKYKGTTIVDGVKIVFNMILWKIGF